ncbi:SDR family NAD(P)-dependent oxidoreductase, partial [Sphaerimonospora cavernae]
RFRSHHVDMADDASIVAAVRAAAEDLGGRIDVVCNIAGVTLATPIDDLDIDRIRTITQVNFIGPLRLISEALPHIPAGSASAIINVASNAATQAVPTMAAYAGSKAALVSASFTLAVELAPKRIRVVPISPSGVQTKMMWEIWEQVKDYEGDWYSRMIHLWGQQESGQAHELAAFIAFAASEEAKYWNASELRIDGGARASF